MIKGIDISEHNGIINFRRLPKDISFVIIRLGWGNGHIDGRFYENANEALDAGLDIGAYFYSYALTRERAREEAAFTAALLQDSGLTPERLKRGLWLDMEDADHYKRNHGAAPSDIRRITKEYIDEMIIQHFPAGLYASLSWLETILRPAPECPVWCAQWGEKCDYPDATMWQYTDRYDIGKMVDGDVWMGPHIG